MTRLILLAALLAPSWLFSQSDKKPVVFGKVNKSELELKSCDFEKDAPAMILWDYGQYYLDFRGDGIYRELQHHVRIKILSEKGKDEANIKLRYISFRNYQGITDLAAATYNLDDAGNVVTTKLDKKLVYEKKVNTRLSEQSFTFPEVKVGSILEYKYTIRNGSSQFWRLQEHIPVQLSRYELNFPSEIDLYIRPFCTLPYDSRDKSTHLRTIKIFTMENIPAMKEEDYMTCENDYVQKIESYITAYTVEGRRYPFLKTWPQIATELWDDEDFGRQLDKGIPRTVELDAALKNVSDDYMKMATVHDYVRRNMNWDGNDNIWALNGVKAAWKDKTGTSGEVNLILVNLLRDAGLKARPLMVSTRSNGLLSTTFPSYEDFNKVLAHVEIGDKVYVLDGTDKHTPPYLIPPDVLCTEAFLLDKDIEHKFRWVELWDPTKLDKNTVLVQAKLDADGKLQGTASVRSFDYARVKRSPFVKGDHKEFFNKFYTTSGTTVEIDSVSFSNADLDSLPLDQVFTFHAPVNQSGDYHYFTTNLFTGLKSNPFIADNRVSDVFFGTNRQVNIVGSFLIPEGYEFDELPKNIRFALEDKSLVVTRIMTANNGILNTRTTIECKRPFYTPEEYPQLQEFYKKMYSLLEEQIVVKKKQS